MSGHRWTRLVAGCVAGLVLLGATSCGSSSDSTSGSSTTVTSDSTTTAPSAATAVEVACEALPWSFSEPVVLEENQPTIAGPEGLVEALEKVEVLVPDDRQDTWAQWVALSTSSDPDAGSDLTERQREELYSMQREVLLVAVEQCDDLAPTWGCVERSSFQAIGETIGADDDDVDSGDQTYPTPEGALDASNGDGDADWVEVDATDGAVLFATLDEDGLVAGASRIEGEGDEWVAGPEVTCNDSLRMAAEEKFENVGEAIPED